MGVTDELTEEQIAGFRDAFTICKNLYSFFVFIICTNSFRFIF
jgi:hypothetical protein